MSEAEQILNLINKNKEYFEDRVGRDIENNRKKFIKINLITKDGVPVTNVIVEIKQQTHDFCFGSNIFMLDEYENPDDNIIYKEKFKKLFNTAIAPFYWDGTEPLKGKLRYDKNSEKFYRRPAIDLVLEFCEINNIRVKGHPLFWHAFIPEWLPKDKNDLKPLIIKRFTEISERYADRISMWDVVNEPSREYFAKYILPNCVILEDDYVDWIFKLADDLFKCNQLFINDTVEASFKNFAGRFSGYFLLIKDMLQRGIRIDAIGLQCHVLNNTLWDNVFDAKKIYDILDCYGSFNRPLHISEITIPTVFDSAYNEEIQAKAAEYLYKICFSHANVEGLVWWNLPDNGAHSGDNPLKYGLITNKYQEKQAYKILDNLINEEWKTNLTINSKENSYITFRGFCGKYDLVIRHNNKITSANIHIKKSGFDEIAVVCE